MCDSATGNCASDISCDNRNDGDRFCADMCREESLINNDTDALCDQMYCYDGKCEADTLCRDDEFCRHACLENGRGGDECSHLKCNSTSGQCLLDTGCQDKSEDFCSDMCIAEVGPDNADACRALTCGASGECETSSCADQPDSDDYCSTMCSAFMGNASTDDTMSWCATGRAGNALYRACR